MHLNAFSNKYGKNRDYLKKIKFSSNLNNKLNEVVLNELFK